MSGLRNGAAPVRAIEDDSDVEEEALVADYKEQVQYEDGMDDLERVSSMTMAQQTDDIQSKLAAAAQPLDFSAPLEVKFQSYDSYCNLFHFILNSEGPVDLEPPSVSLFVSCLFTCRYRCMLADTLYHYSIIGHGM
jgi:translation initiation factor 3 subunit L